MSLGESRTCVTCGTAFVPKFRFQVETTAGVERHYCSQACRLPELRRREAAEHVCAVCGASFSLRLAYQVVALRSGRRVVCSESCRAALLEPAPAERAPPAARVLAVMNQKGGTGKTTTSVSLAAGLASLGHRTLLVDLDAQGGVGVSLGVRGRTTVSHVLRRRFGPEAALVPARPNLDVILADLSLDEVNRELAGIRDPARVLSASFAALGTPLLPYAFVVLDCPPTLSLVAENALVFARELIVPVSCDYLSLVGVGHILATLRHVRDDLLHPIELAGVLPTFYDVRNRIAREAIASLEAHFARRVLPPIRINAKLKEAPSVGRTIFEHAPASHGAEDYLTLARWIERATDAPPIDVALAFSAAPRSTGRGS